MELAPQLQSPTALPPCKLAARSAGLGRPTLPPLSVARDMRCAIFCVRGRAGVQPPPHRAPMPWGHQLTSPPINGDALTWSAPEAGRGIAGHHLLDPDLDPVLHQGPTAAGPPIV